MRLWRCTSPHSERLQHCRGRYVSHEMFLQEHLAGVGYRSRGLRLPTFPLGFSSSWFWRSRIGDMFLQEHCGKLGWTLGGPTEPCGRFLGYFPLLSLEDAGSGRMTVKVRCLTDSAFHFYHYGYSTTKRFDRTDLWLRSGRVSVDRWDSVQMHSRNNGGFVPLRRLYLSYIGLKNCYFCLEID